MDESELNFWKNEVLEWKRMQQKTADKYFDAVRSLAAALGMDPEQTSMAEVVSAIRALEKRIEDLEAENKRIKDYCAKCPIQGCWASMHKPMFSQGDVP